MLDIQIERSFALAGGANRGFDLLALTLHERT